MGWLEKNINEAKPNYCLFFSKTPKRGEDNFKNPQKVALGLGKKEEDISSSRMTIDCGFSSKSTILKS